MKTERHPVRVLSISEYGKPLKVLLNAKEHRNSVKKVVTKSEHQLLPILAYDVRGDLSSQELQLDNRLREKYSLWNMEVGQMRSIVGDLKIIDTQMINLNQNDSVNLIRLLCRVVALICGKSLYLILKN